MLSYYIPIADLAAFLAYYLKLSMATINLRTIERNSEMITLGFIVWLVDTLIRKKWWRFWCSVAENSNGIALA